MCAPRDRTDRQDLLDRGGEARVRFYDAGRMESWTGHRCSAVSGKVQRGAPALSRRTLSMEGLQLPHIWAAGAILAGFHITAFTWRITREIAIERRGQPTWLTLADGLVGLSFFWVVAFVFAVPLKMDVSAELTAKFLGVGLFLFAAHPIVLAGHYNLYCSWDKTTPRPRITNQEIAAFLVSVVLVLGASWCLLL